MTGLTETKLAKFFANAFKEVVLPHLENIYIKITKVEKSLSGVEQQLDKVEVRLGNVEDKLVKIDDRLVRYDVKFDNHEK